MGLSQSNEVSEPTETENDEIFNDSYKDLEEKHERRQILIQQKSKELQDLRDEVNILERENKALRDNENNLGMYYSCLIIIMHNSPRCYVMLVITYN